MPKLNVNIDLVARLRELRKTRYPDLIEAMRIVEAAGADGITVHLRQDRRHIQDADLPLLRKHVTTRLNLEMANTREMLDIALCVKPDIVTLVPESPGEVTTEGGLDVVAHEQAIAASVRELEKAGIHVSIFVDPYAKQIDAALRARAKSVELCTAKYSAAEAGPEQDRDFENLRAAADHTRRVGLGLNLGHGLDYQNTRRLAALEGVEDFNIGHAIIIHAVFVGLEAAVKQMLELVKG